MSEIETIIRYDGPALAGHEMDVEELAPALLALASLIQAANHKFNGDRSAVRVVVNADIEQQCFQLKIKIITDFLSRAKGFLDGDVETLKDICEWIGIIGGGGFTLFRLLVALGRKQQDQTIFKTDAEAGSTVYNIKELHVHGEVPLQVQQLLSDPVIVGKAQEVFRPLVRKGYDTIGFIEPKRGQVFEADTKDAKAVLALPAPQPIEVEEEDNDDEPTYATGPAWVDTSHFRGAAKWALMWNGVKIDAKMPEAFLEQFQANEIIVIPNTKLTVRMKIIPKVDENGGAIGPTSFVVEDVLDIELPPKVAKQGGLFDEIA
jgi:hypothetical protein